MNWQPIETAPKDGTWILGINNRGNCAVIIWSDRALVVDRYLPDGQKQYKSYPGWIHPFSLGELSEFWNGACGSIPVAWAALPRGEDARVIVERFTKKKVA